MELIALIILLVFAIFIATYLFFYKENKNAEVQENVVAVFFLALLYTVVISGALLILMLIFI